MGKQSNIFAGGALEQLKNTHLEDVSDEAESQKIIVNQEKNESEKAIATKSKEKTSETKPTAPRQKPSSLQDDFKKTQKGRGEERKKKLVAIPASYDKKISDMIEKGECESFNQLVNFLLDKFFEN